MALSCYPNVCKHRGTLKKIPVNLRAVLPFFLTPTLLNRSSGITSDSERHKPFPPGIMEEFWDLPATPGFTEDSWGKYREGGVHKADL